MRSSEEYEGSSCNSRCGGGAIWMDCALVLEYGWCDDGCDMEEPMPIGGWRIGGIGGGGCK